MSGIALEYSESELIKMASPFGHSVEVLMATEIDTTTCLEWKKVCHFRMYIKQFSKVISSKIQHFYVSLCLRVFSRLY